MLEKLTKQQLIDTINVINKEPKFKFGDQVYVMYFEDKAIECPKCKGKKVFEVDGVKAYCIACYGRGCKIAKQISFEKERDSAIIDRVKIDRSFGSKEPWCNISYSVIGNKGKKWTGNFNEEQLSYTVEEAQEKCRIYNQKQIAELY